ncbi:MAG TPA: extracellular solute-binding protein [Spirochaetia bacterium]|nr:extracellular solute-binding protein [Spirochaetia bacterium]
MKLHRLSLAAIVLAIAIIVPAFGGGNAESSSTGASSTPTKLVFWTFQAIHKAFYADMLKMWNDKNPTRQIDISSTDYPNADMHNKLLLALQSGVGAPDFVDININYFTNFMKGDIQLLPLNRIVDPVRKDFVQSRFAIYSKDGKVYGLPTHVGATVVYYNKEITDKAGVNIDQIKTWDDFIAAGKKVVAVAGVPMTSFEVTNQRPFWPMIVQQHSDYVDGNGKVILDNETNVRTLQAMYDMMYKDKIAVAMPGGNTGSEQFWTFMDKGGAASLIMPMWYMSRFTSYMPDLKGKIYVRPMPIWKSGDLRSAGMGGTGTAVTKQTKSPDLTIDFLAFAKLSHEAAVTIWKELRFDPARFEAWTDPALTAPDPYFGNEDVFKLLRELGPDQMPSPLSETTSLSAAAQDLVVNQVMFKALSDRSQTPAEALKAAADELRKQQ